MVERCAPAHSQEPTPPHPTPAAWRLRYCCRRALRACSHPGSAAQAPTQGGAAAEAPGFDPLWLRYPRVPAAQLAGYRSLLGTSAAVVCAAGAPCGDAASQAQLSAAAAELQTGLSGLLGTAFTAAVTSKPPVAGTRLVASVLGAGAPSPPLGKEGFRLRRDPSAKTVRLEAGAPSGLLYGVFKLLSLLQQHKPIPAEYESAPAMGLRVWDLCEPASLSSFAHFTSVNDKPG